MALCHSKLIDMETKSNKQIVANFYRDIIRDQKLELLDEYVHDNYIQHSPMLKDGKAALLEALNYLKTLPKPVEPGPSPIVRMIAENDMVVAHLDISFMGKRRAVVDIFRLKDGKVIEHWDVQQDVPEVMPHGNGMF
jgi:predicted SnoaL-like aldol condensation-catalyzing enzyme